MNPTELESISTKFQLGTPIGVATSVDGCRGGSFMWSVHTDKGRYAIKQLAPAIDLKNERIVTKYELSEAVANQFAQHAIRAVSAMEMSGKRLFITDNKGYLIYPWVDG